MCGQCGAVLPSEMVLTDAQAQAHEQERQWARHLADKFDTTGRATKAAPGNSRPSSAESAESGVSALEVTLRRMSCASEFKYRKRHTWLYVIGCAITLLTSVEFFLFIIGGPSATFNRESLSVWLIFSGISVLAWFMMWKRAVPICPNCRQNIRTCLTEYCHVCGKPLSHQRCTDCGVDNSWTGWLRPNSNGSFRWIACCPACGVELDTCIPRWRAGDTW
jgi:hypothetical protein